MTFIIAEAGINHGGNMTTAKRLINAAKHRGADAVKFQLFNSETLWGDDRIKQYELSYSQIAKLKQEADSINIEFMCTPFDVDAVNFLVPLVKRMKVASGCRTPEILKAISATKLPVLLSMGMANITDIEMAWQSLGSARNDITFMQCTSCYPCSPKDVNLQVISHEINTRLFRWPSFGLSDHTRGCTAAIAACAMGATVIEKHLKLDRNETGPDMETSATPGEFYKMVKAIREVEDMMGSSKKTVLPCETTLRDAWYNAR